MVVRTWSVDDGFGDWKGYDGKRELHVPSYVTDWFPLPQTEMARKEYMDDPYSHITVEHDGIIMVIGKGAQENSNRWNGQENKHNSLHFKTLLKGFLALMAENDEDELHIDPLVMSLPVDQETPERKEQLIKLAKGTHEVKVTLADGTVLNKTIHVVNVIVTSQPFGSYFSKVMDEQGNIANELLASQTNVIFDLGARTLNVLMVNGFKQNTKYSFTENLGVYGAWDKLRTLLVNRHGARYGLPKVLEYAEKGFIPGGIDIRTLVEQCYSSHADELLTEFGTRFVDNKDEIDNIILTGGGSHVLSKYLKKAIEEQYSAKVHILDRYATSRGLRNFGVRVARLAEQKKKVTKKEKVETGQGD